jgi:HK97 family phage prohead protease
MNKPTINEPEKRSFTANARASQGDEFAIAGRCAAYNTLSSDLGGFKEMLAVGCFDRSINSGADIKCLANHDASRVLGTLASGTLRLVSDTNGLNFHCRLNPAIQFHREVYEITKAGLSNQCSFAFTIAPEDQDWGMENDATGKEFVKRTIRNLTLFEVSAAVTFPAYPGDATNVAARKAGEVVSDAQRRARCAALGEQIRAQRIADAAKAVAEDALWASRVDDLKKRFPG